MNKEELEAAKKIAEIEGYRAKIKKFKSSAYPCGYHSHVYLYDRPNGDGFWNNEYTPFDWEILGNLTFKYEVETSIVGGRYVRIWTHGCNSVKVEFEDNEQSYKLAILKCIIKSQEK